MLAAFMSLLAGAAVAQESVNDQREPAEQTAQAGAELSPAEERALQPLQGEYGSAVERRWQEILNDSGLREGENSGDVVISSGIATVSLEKGVPGWIESRRFAHDLAHARAKANMVALMSQEVRRTGNVRMLENATFGQGHMEDVESLDFAARIALKLGDFTEATIDMALEQLDPAYDTQKYSGMDIPERQVVIENLFELATNRIASRLIGGATTFRVLEGPTIDGNGHEILVGVIWSPRLASLAGAIMDGRTSSAAGKGGSPVGELLPQTVGEAVAAMGTRVFIDENGDRAILSFAQAEPANVSPNERDIARRAAISRAENFAASQIAAFVGENVTLRNPVTASELTRVYADLGSRSTQIEVEQVQEIRTATRPIKIDGAQIVWRQVFVHPETEQEAALVAMLWSPTAQASVKRMESAMKQAESSDPEKEESQSVSELESDTQDGSNEPGMLFESQGTDPEAY